MILLRIIKKVPQNITLKLLRFVIILSIHTLCASMVVSSVKALTEIVSQGITDLSGAIAVLLFFLCVAGFFLCACSLYLRWLYYLCVSKKLHVEGSVSGFVLKVIRSKGNEYLTTFESKIDSDLHYRLINPLCLILAIAIAVFDFIITFPVITPICHVLDEILSNLETAGLAITMVIIAIVVILDIKNTTKK